MAGEEGKITAIEAEVTSTEMTGRIAAIQADATHTLMAGRITAIGPAGITFTVSGSDLSDPGGRITAIKADVTRTIHHVMHYATSGGETELSYERPAPNELRYSAPIDETTFEPVASPPRGGRNPGDEDIEE